MRKYKIWGGDRAENDSLYIWAKDADDAIGIARLTDQSICISQWTGNEKSYEEVIKLVKALEQEPSEDAISRKAVVEYIKASDADLGHDSENEFAVEDILNMPPVTPTQKWIPVSERLPKDRREVLVTAYWHETYQVMMASYFGDGLWWCVPFNNCGEHTQRLNPNAWMPLPDPYKGRNGR